MAKEPGIDVEGREVLKCGFKIGGGIDQDYRKSPQGYTDNVNISTYIDFKMFIGKGCFTITPHNVYTFIHFQGIYVTEVHEGSPAAKAGLRIHDKILQVRGFCFSCFSNLILNIDVGAGVTSLNKTYI